MPRSKPTTLSIGSVSHATMREEDLIPAFLSQAQSLRLSRQERKTVSGIARDSELDGYYEGTAVDAEGNESDPASDLEALFDILGNHTPDYCYFGAHEGDGSDYGCWPSMDSLEDDARFNGDVVKINAGDKFPSAVGADFTHLMVVTDHGNVTLYRRSGRTWRECWSIV